MQKIIDLRSDTVTHPTPAMREAMYKAEVGDDGFGEDPTIIKLEEMAAAKVGKEAAMFVASGVMANLVSVLAHTQRGDEVILGNESHIFIYEVAGAATFGGLQMRTVPNVDGKLVPEDVEEAIRPVAVNNPRTGLICLENTHNRCGGVALTSRYTATISEIAHRNGMPLYLDGARIFNAATALGVSAAELAAPADSLSFCLSKGLSCPAGSLVCGSKEYVLRARKYRKMVGGGMRQVGILAAAGIVALEQMIDRLAEDHANAKALASGLAEIQGVTIDPKTVATNIVVFELAADKLGPTEFIARLATSRVKAVPFGGRRIRMVTHYGIERSDIDEALRIVGQALKSHL